MRGAALGMAIALLLVGPLGCASALRLATTPDQPFEELAPPAVPDYSDPESWAAFPGQDSAASEVPPDSGAVDQQATAAADVFFVHPTTYFGGPGWNAPIDDTITRWVTSATLAGQASSFNGAGRIYAPRFRQMTLHGFAHPEVRERGLELAYQDVRRAFQYYLDHSNHGRPILLAGHSQGSRHVMQLLREFFASGPVRRQLVAAYPIGTRITDDPLVPGDTAVPVCQSAQQTGCLVTWRTFSDGADPLASANPGESVDGPAVCVNPLTWRQDDRPAPASANLGSVPLVMLGGPDVPQPGRVGARCENGVLRIDPPAGAGYRLAHDGGDYHAYDYDLFYMNLRDNAKRRVDAFVRGNALYGISGTAPAPGRR